MSPTAQLARVWPEAAPRASAQPRWPRSLWLMLAVGAIVRLALWCSFSSLPIRIWDEQDYNSLAKNLVERSEFALTPGELTSMRPPLYPALVASLYRLFGMESYQAVRLFQAMISLATVVVVYLIGREVFSRRVGVWAAGCTCFYPSLLGANNLLLTEVVFTLFLCLTCLAVVRGIQGERAGWFALAGVFMGLGALTRSVLWLFPPVLALFLVALWQRDFRKRIGAAALVMLSFAAVIAPWAIRNSRLQQTFVTIDVMGGRNFMMGNYEHTPLWRAWDAISMQGDRAWFSLLCRRYPHATSLTQGQRDKLAFRYGADYIRQHPGLTLQRGMVKFFSFWQLERELVAGAARGYFGRFSTVPLALLTLSIFGSYAAALLLALLGVFMAPPRNRVLHMFLLLLIAFICGIHTVVFGHSRYHLPLMPLVLLYSAAAVVHVPSIWQRRRSLRFALACAAGGVMLAAWCYEILAIDLERYLNALSAAA